MYLQNSIKIRSRRAMDLTEALAGIFHRWHVLYDKITMAHVIEPLCQRGFMAEYFNLDENLSWCVNLVILGF